MSTETKKQSGCARCNRFLKDKCYRKKLTLTLSTYGSYMILGWLVTQIGPALPDLQLLANIDLETASWLITAWSIGFVPGSFVAGLLYDRYNRLAIMLASTFITAVSCLCLPYVGSFPAMVAVRVVTGLSTGGIDTGANTIVPSIWGNGGAPYMQALYLSYTIGGILSPLATQPFMVPRLDEKPELHVTQHNTTHSTQPDSGSVIPYSWSETNGSRGSNYSQEDGGGFSNNVVIESNIHPAFIITAVLVTLSCIPYIAMMAIGGYETRKEHASDGEDAVENGIVKKAVVNNRTQNGDSPNEESTIDKDCMEVQNEGTKMISEKSEETSKNIGGNLQGCGKLFVLAAVAGMNFTYSASENSLSDFLVTFCRDYLHWDNGPSVTLTSMYWITSCFGGLMGVVLVKLLGPARLLGAALCVWNVSFITLLVASLYRVQVLIWASLALSGLAMVVIIPTVISWTAVNVCRISGKVSSVLMIASGTGLTLNPIFIGYMMEEYSYICFILIVLVESVLCTLFYIIAQSGRRCYTRKHNVKEVRVRNDRK